MLLLIFYVLLGNQNKPVIQTEETKTNSVNKESDVVSTMTETAPKSSVTSLNTETKPQILTSDSKISVTNSKHLSSATFNNDQPSIFSSDCTIIRPKPQHPSHNHETETNRRMSISKSASSLTTSDSALRMTRSKSAVTVKQGKTTSPKLPEKRKLPQDLEYNQKKIRSGNVQLQFVPFKHALYPKRAIR